MEFLRLFELADNALKPHISLGLSSPKGIEGGFARSIPIRQYVPMRRLRCIPVLHVESQRVCDAGQAARRLVGNKAGMVKALGSFHPSRLSQ
jgi:hypothetical protein